MIRCIAIVVHKTSYGTEVEIAFNPSGDGSHDSIITRHPPGTTLAQAITKLVPMLQYREDREVKALLNQPPKGTT